MRPAPARVLGTVRAFSTTVHRPQDSLAAAFGKTSKATKRAGGGIGASASPRARPTSSFDDDDVTQAGAATAEEGAEAKANTVLPIFKYHGNWGIPKTPGVRHLKMPYSPWLWNGKPFKALTTPLRKTGGRGGQTGRIIRRHIGGGFKRRLRKVDFMRMEEGPQDVVRIEWDPNRSAHIALLRNRTGLGPDGGWSYIVAPDGLRAGDVITSYRSGVPKGLVPQWDAEVARLDAQAVEREAREAEVKARRAKYLGSVVPHAGLGDVDAQLRIEDEPVPAPHEIAEPEIAAIEGATVTTAPEHESVYVSSSSRSPSSRRSFSTSASAASTSAAGARSFSTSPVIAAEQTDLEKALAQKEPPKPKSPSILPPKQNARWTQATAGINPSFALNLLRTLIIKPGNVVQLTLIPINTTVHCVTLSATGKAALCRAAGTQATIVSHQKPDEKGNVYSFVRLQSGEVRKIPSDAYATIGQVSNKFHGQRNLGKAGRSRNLGYRPRVRGVAMNAYEHPHGGGRGKSKGNKPPRSIYGKLTRGVRTRKPGVNGHKNGNKMVVKERPRGKATPATMELKAKV